MRNRKRQQLWRRIRLRIHKKFNLNFERIQSLEGCKTSENGLQLISVQSFLDGDFLLSLTAVLSNWQEKSWITDRE